MIARAVMATLLSQVLACTAAAADVQITAEFKPDLNDPSARSFTNTTPWTGVCAQGHMERCRQNNWWSIDTQLRGRKDAVRVTDWGPHGFYIRMPPPRTVQVTSEDGSSTFDLNLRIIGAAMRYTDEEGDGAENIASSGGARNCDFGITGHGPYTLMRMLLRRDGGQGTAVCSLHWVNTNNYAIPMLDFVYALDTPAPLDMRSGIYTGSTIYSFGGSGEGADFDLGTGVTLSDRLVHVHFRLDVQHAFRLDIPPGSERALLVPKGGWSSWSEQGIVPAALERELAFGLSSSGHFSVTLHCQFPQPDGRCGLRNTSTEAEDAPLDVTLTLPGFRNVASGAAAVAVPLSSIGAPPVFGAESVVIGRPSRLRFTVQGSPVRSMLAHPGTRYRGDVTVVFDADP